MKRLPLYLFLTLSATGQTPPVDSTNTTNPPLALTNQALSYTATNHLSPPTNRAPARVAMPATPLGSALLQHYDNQIAAVRRQIEELKAKSAAASQLNDLKVRATPPAQAQPLHRAEDARRRQHNAQVAELNRKLAGLELQREEHRRRYNLPPPAKTRGKR